jgi:hypothetical protein
VILDDLSRADVQAFILYQLSTGRKDFTYAKGRTYLGAVSLLIPHWILSDKPDTVSKEGTEIQFGGGSYIPMVMSSTRVYGMTGEGMLNFGPWCVPFVMGVFGIIVGLLRSWVASLQRDDARLLLAPLGIYLCFALMIGDSDNVVFGLVKYGFLPFFVILACSRKSVSPQRELVS